MTAAEEARLAAMTDDDIDYSDIPDQTGFDASPRKASASLNGSRNGHAAKKKKTSVA